jgi:hypothetical protein
VSHPQHHGPGNHGGGYAPVPPAPNRPARNGLGTAALVLGIVGIPLALIPLIGVVGFICGLVGTVLGAIGVVRARSGKATNFKVALAGTILSVIAMIVSIAIWVSFANAVSASLGPDTVVPAGPADSAPPATEQQTEFEAGQAADIEGLVIAAGPLKKVSQQFGSPVVCSDVNYENRSDENRDYNGGFDWKLQDPNNVIVSPTFADGVLSAGQLAPGGKVAGKVCFNDPKLSGQYTIVNDALDLSNTQVRWKASL